MVEIGNNYAKGRVFHGEETFGGNFPGKTSHGGKGFILSALSIVYV